MNVTIIGQRVTAMHMSSIGHYRLSDKLVHK
jgi:hypothetical protein